MPLNLLLILTAPSVKQFEKCFAKTIQSTDGTWLFDHVERKLPKTNGRRIFHFPLIPSFVFIHFFNFLPSRCFFSIFADLSLQFVKNKYIQFSPSYLFRYEINSFIMALFLTCLTVSLYSPGTIQAGIGEILIKLCYQRTLFFIYITK